MSYKILPFLIIFTFLFGAAYADTAVIDQKEVKEVKKEKISSSGKEFESPDGNYMIVFPANWDIKEGFMGMDVIALSEIEGPEDHFRENANIIFADLDQSISKEGYYDQNITLLEKLLTDYNLEDEGTMDVGGVEAKWIKYTHRMGEIDAAVLQYLMLNGNRAYVITFTANPADFAKHEATFKSILNSFQFNK